MANTSIVLALLAMPLFHSCGPSKEQDSPSPGGQGPVGSKSAGVPFVGEGMEVEIPLDLVPFEVREAAQVAVPGIVFDEAEMKRRQGKVLYSLDGQQDGVEYEIELTETGAVLRVELDSNEDDDDDDS